MKEFFRKDFGVAWKDLTSNVIISDIVEDDVYGGFPESRCSKLGAILPDGVTMTESVKRGLGEVVANKEIDL